MQKKKSYQMLQTTTSMNDTTDISLKYNEKIADFYF